MITITEWEWDDGNEDELVKHHCTSTIVEQVWLEEPLFRRNKRLRAATYQMIGQDRGGAFWVICMVETAVFGRWRAITGWSAEPEDINWYKKGKR